MCFFCQSLAPETDDYDFHGLTTAAPSDDTTTSTASGDKPVYSLDEVAYQLTHGYWQSNGSDWRAFDVQTGDTLTVNIDGLDATGQAAAMTALASWTAVSGLQFMTTSGGADISFQDTESGAYAYSAVYTSRNETAYSVVNVHTSWQSNADYYLQTYIHEIGHALGLGHGGNYNGSADFDSQTHYANDSWQMSVMSYFDQSENPNVDASFSYLLTPQMADVLAIQNLYGTPDNVNTGNSTYGDNTNLTGSGMGLVAGYAVTIFDSSGIDLIDLGTRSHDQRLSLVDATWSDLDGYIGTFAIASGAVIENAITGSGDDHVTGNTAANDIQTGEGADTIVAGAGDDTINGGAGEDTVVFTGASADYGLIWDGALWITDTDLTDGDDGTDMLTGVETLSFADGSYGTMYSGTSKITVRLYDNENSVAKETLEIDSADKHKWDTIARTHDETGTLSIQTNTYDDGRVQEILYIEGQRSELFVAHGNDSANWVCYTQTYDTDTGARLSRLTIYDDGREIEIGYDTSGQMVSYLLTDGADAFGWSSIERSYAADGTLSVQTKTYDGGRIEEITYIESKRSVVITIDANHTADWSSRADTYDIETGLRLSRLTIYDDGREIEVAYDTNGKMLSHVLADGADEFNWSELARSYDADGVLESQLNTFDDGRISEVTYSDGIRSSAVVTDVFDVYDWETITRSYNAEGTLSGETTVWDA